MNNKANGFGRSKKESKKMAINQMVTFLIQKNLIKYGLKDKSFLYKREQPSAVQDTGKRQDFVPVDQKKLRNPKILAKYIMKHLGEDNFEKALHELHKIRNYRPYEIYELSLVWDYIVARKNISHVQSFLLLLSNSGEERLDEKVVQTPGKESETNKLMERTYGFKLLPVANPYQVTTLDDVSCDDVPIQDPYSQTNSGGVAQGQQLEARKFADYLLVKQEDFMEQVRYSHITVQSFATS